MSNYRIHIPVLFGVEAATRDELYALGYDRDDVLVQDGLVILTCRDEDAAKAAVAKCNFWLRTAERVLFEIASFSAKTFDELYFSAKQIAWERYLDFGKAILVNGYSRKSQLYGVPAIQRTLKKTIVDRMLAQHGNTGGYLREDKRLGEIDVRFAIVEDQITIMLDTSGEGLHKRGYRPLRHEAPLRETLAAAILHYSFFLRNRAHGEGLFDPMCGSGTFLIEAALMLKNDAPGLRRHFAAERMQYFGVTHFDREREYAKLARVDGPTGVLFGADISNQAVQQTKDNAKRAGVAELIDVRRGSIADWSPDKLFAATHLNRLLVVTNPPYGERLTTPEEASKLLKLLGHMTGDGSGQRAPGLRVSILSPDEQFERTFGERSDKKRKLYNGMIRCTLHQYFKHAR